MITKLNIAVLFGYLFFFSIQVFSADKSVGQENIRQAIEQGAKFLYQNQNATGWWTDSNLPALTGLALVALETANVSELDEKYESERRRAYDYLVSLAKPDGSIHDGRLINYNTACSLMALSVSGDSNYRSLIEKARAYISGSQIDLGKRGEQDNPNDGGVGYNDKYNHSDMNNTLMAIEAMRLSESAIRQKDQGRKPLKHDLDWKALEHFLASCQNLPELSDNPNLSNQPEDRGGFIYHPGESKAGEVSDKKTKRVALRSYGSISYAGMMSFAYARVSKNDDRVSAVIDWLSKNYTLDENPGMGQEGLYYYFHLMSKALTAHGVKNLKGPDSKSIDWRNQLASKLIALQNGDGSWKNSNKRWMEGDSNLTTSYVLIALSLLLK
tara:strand:- start:903 stop:2054 length:1152 start_codon:yes stop_codon:yes gene_type:complete